MNKRKSNVDKCFLPYPEVITDPAPPYCDCREKEYAEYGSFEVGPHYCPKHNVIVMENLFLPKDPEDTFQSVIEIVNHETLHWIVGKILGDPASFGLDEPRVFDFIENCFQKKGFQN